jgi:hypothetical protein
LHARLWKYMTRGCLGSVSRNFVAASRIGLCLYS